MPAIGKLTKAALISIVSKNAAKKYLLQSLESSIGLTAKARQTLAMRMGVPPNQIEQILALDDVLQIMEKNAPHLLEQIDEINEIGISASVGQVHRAKFITGELVAIKIQYPDVEKHMLKNLDLLLKIFADYSPAKNYSFNVSEYKSYLNAQIKSECNYLLESHQQIYFRNIFAQLDNIYVPKIYKDFTGSKNLVQEWAPGASIPAINPELADQIIPTLLQALLKPIFSYHCMHADFHPGNWAYNLQSKKVILYDFGSIIQFTENESQKLKEILTKFLKNDYDVKNDFIQLGFKSELIEKISDEFPYLAKELFTRFINESNPTDPSLSKSLDDLLGSRKWFFRNAGPPWFMLFLKSLSGFFFAIKQLQYTKSLRPLISDICEITTLNSFVNLNDKTIISPRSLFINIKKSGTEVCRFQFPCRAIEDIEDLIPSEHRSKLEQLDINKIKHEVISSNYAAQTVFHIYENTNEYRCWIE